jgi:hypothetical protein
MDKRPSRKRDALILPAVLLTVYLLEDIATYKVRQVVHNVYLRTLIVVISIGVAFAVAAEWVTPWLVRFLTQARRDSRHHGGTLGLVVFYGVAYGALYYAFLVDQRYGPGWLLPLALR